jgi:CRISPR-associated protein Cmr1
LGDSDQKATAIRPTSIKGALRFWWRAMNGHLDLKTLAEKEAKLFGSTDGGGVFSLAVSESKIKKNDPNPSGEKDPAISVQKFGALHYLLGQGLNATRNAITEGKFTITLLFNTTATDNDRQEIEQTLQLFGVLGSLGSRARHGWGSVSLIDVKNAQHIVIPKTEAEYQQLLQSFLTGKTAALPEFTAFSGKSRIDLATSNKDPMKLLNKTGSELQMYRSFGNNGKVGGKDAERNFKQDHDLVLEHIQGRQADIAPKRVVFGLPHNYFYSDGKGKADVNAKVGNDETRRASPLLTHIQKIGDTFILVHVLLPAVFLPDTAKITIKGGKAPTAHITPNVDYTVITNFMDRFTGATKVLAK